MKGKLGWVLSKLGRVVTNSSKRKDAAGQSATEVRETPAAWLYYRCVTMCTLDNAGATHSALDLAMFFFRQFSSPEVTSLTGDDVAVLFMDKLEEAGMAPSQDNHDNWGAYLNIMVQIIARADDIKVSTEASIQEAATHGRTARTLTFDVFSMPWHRWC